MKGNVETIAERLQIAGIRFVLNILRSYMQGLDGEVGHMDFGTTCKKLQQAKRVFATRQADEDFVVLVDQLVLSQRLVKGFPKSFFERHSDVCCCATATYWTIS